MLPGMIPGVMASSDAAYRYFRLEITKIVDTSVPRRATVVEMGLSDDGGSSWQPTSTMTSNSAPSPLVAIASDENSISYQAFMAFDKALTLSANDSWIGLTDADVSGVFSPAAYLQIDLGSGNEITVDRLRIAPWISSGNDRSLVDFELKASNTGSFSGEEVTLLTQTGLTTGWTSITYREFTV